MIQVPRFGRVLAALALTCLAHAVIAQNLPSLTDEIRRVIESQGPAAASARFKELYPDEEDAWNVDMQAMTSLGQEYMMAGDMERGMAVLEMASQIAAVMATRMSANMSGSMAGQAAESAEIMRQLQEQERQAQAARAEEEAIARQEEAARQERVERQSRGQVRTDLDRFAGLYNDPHDANRTLFVTESCDGYLVAGPMWADVGPWWMRSASDTVFTYADSFLSFAMDFEVDGSGQAVRIMHDIDGIGSPVERSGPLPADWGACLERPIR